MTIFHVRHVTTYRYRRAVRFGEHRLMFRPRDSYDQRLLARRRCRSIRQPGEVRWIHDVFGNCVALVSFPRKAARELRFETAIRLEHTPQAGPDFRIDPAARHYPFAYSPDEAGGPRADRCERALPGRRGRDRHGRGSSSALAGRTETGRLLMTLCYAIHESFVYSRRVEPARSRRVLTLAAPRAAPAATSRCS